MTSEKTSVLGKLTSETMQGKKAEARKLTPVAGEGTPTVLPKTRAPFPNDMPQEVVQQKADELTRIIEHLTEARDAMLALIGAPPAANVVDLDAKRKQREADGDAQVVAAVEADSPSLTAEFKADFAAKQAAAQAAVFKPAENDLGWVCPTHGKAAQKTSPTTGREFVGCPDCNAFKRG